MREPPEEWEKVLDTAAAYARHYYVKDRHDNDTANYSLEFHHTGWLNTLSQDKSSWETPNYRKLNNSVWEGHNWSDFQNLLKTIQDNGSWYGSQGVTWETIRRLGFLEPPPRLNAERTQRLAQLANPVPRRRMKNLNAEEGDLMIDRLKSFEPEFLYAKNKKKKPVKILNLVTAAGANCCITAETLAVRTAFAASIIDALEANQIRVNYWAGYAGRSRLGAMYSFWQVKRSQDPLYMPSLLRDSGHPSVFRTIWFKYLETQPSTVGGGLGSSQFDYLRLKEHRPDGLIQLLEQHVGSPTVVLDLLPTDQNIDPDELDEILDKHSVALADLIASPPTSGVHFISAHTVN